jgi:hypothetical protein
MEPLSEADFEDCSYGFGPKGTYTALLRTFTIKRKELQGTKQSKESELQFARFNLSGELDRLYAHL